MMDLKQLMQPQGVHQQSQSHLSLFMLSVILWVSLLSACTSKPPPPPLPPPPPPRNPLPPVPQVDQIEQIDPDKDPSVLPKTTADS